MDFIYMRIFAAIQPPLQIREAIAKYITGLCSEFRDTPFKWESVEKLHITLKFEGNLDENRLENFLSAVRSAASHPGFEVSVEKTGAFTRGRGPNILWLGIGRGRKSLAQISSEIESSLTAGGRFQPSVNFNPHITIARLKPRGNYERLIWKHLDTDFPALEFTASDITVFKSELTPTGSLYTKIAEFQLSGVRK